MEPPLNETPNKGNLSIMNRIICPKSYVIQRFHCIVFYSQWSCNTAGNTLQGEGMSAMTVGSGKYDTMDCDTVRYTSKTVCITIRMYVEGAVIS